MPDYGEPVPDAELEPVLEELESEAEEYAVKHLEDPEVVRAEYGVEIYWGAGQEDNVIALTAFNSDHAYVSAGVSNTVDKRLQPLSMTNLADLTPMMEGAQGTAESMNFL